MIDNLSFVPRNSFGPCYTEHFTCVTDHDQDGRDLIHSVEVCLREHPTINCGSSSPETITASYFKAPSTNRSGESRRKEVCGLLL